MTKQRQYWVGQIPTTCDTCRRPINKTFYDARLPNGYWVCVCHACFLKYNCRLGTGTGQKYDAKTGEKLA